MDGLVLGIVLVIVMFVGFLLGRAWDKPGCKGECRYGRKPK